MQINEAIGIMDTAFNNNFGCTKDAWKCIRKWLVEAQPQADNSAMVPLADVLEILHKRYPASEVAEYWPEVEQRSNRHQ